MHKKKLLKIIEILCQRITEMNKQIADVAQRLNKLEPNTRGEMGLIIDIDPTDIDSLSLAIELNLESLYIKQQCVDLLKIGNIYVF